MTEPRLLTTPDIDVMHELEWLTLRSLGYSWWYVEWMRVWYEVAISVMTYAEQGYEFGEAVVLTHGR